MKDARNYLIVAVRVVGALIQGGVSIPWRVYVTWDNGRVEHFEATDEADAHQIACENMLRGAHRYEAAAGVIAEEARVAAVIGGAK